MAICVLLLLFFQLRSLSKLCDRVKHGLKRVWHALHHKCIYRCVLSGCRHQHIQRSHILDGFSLTSVRTCTSVWVHLAFFVDCSALWTFEKRNEPTFTEINGIQPNYCANKSVHESYEWFCYRESIKFHNKQQPWHIHSNARSLAYTTRLEVLIRHLALAHTHTRKEIPLRFVDLFLVLLHFAVFFLELSTWKLNSYRHMLLKEGIVRDNALSHFQIRNSMKPCDRMTHLSFVMFLWFFVTFSWIFIEKMNLMPFKGVLCDIKMK